MFQRSAPLAVLLLGNCLLVSAAHHEEKGFGDGLERGITGRTTEELAAIHQETLQDIQKARDELLVCTFTGAILHRPPNGNKMVPNTEYGSSFTLSNVHVDGKVELMDEKGMRLAVEYAERCQKIPGKKCKLNPDNFIKLFMEGQFMLLVRLEHSWANKVRGRRADFITKLVKFCEGNSDEANNWEPKKQQTLRADLETIRPMLLDGVDGLERLPDEETLERRRRRRRLEELYA